MPPRASRSAARRTTPTVHQQADRADVLLIDPALSHVWKPLLHELAAGTRRAHEGAMDFMAQAWRHGYRSHPGRMEGMDRRLQEVRLAPLLDDDGQEIAPCRAIGYDTLVLCLGSVANDFGPPGVREHALSLELHGLLALWSYHALRRQHGVRLLGPERTLLTAVGAWLGEGAGPKVKLH